MHEQIDIFEQLVERYKITKPIRLIEFFAGVGAQHAALKRLNAKIDRVTIVEWAVKSIQAYKDMHTEDDKDYAMGMTDEEIENILVGNVSLDYNEPITLQQVKRKTSSWEANSL